MVGFFLPEGIDYEGIYVVQVGHLALADSLHVGDIDEGGDALRENRRVLCGVMLKAKAEYGQLAMHHLNGRDDDVAYLERLMGVYLVQVYGRHARVTVFGEAVRQHLKQSLLGQGVGIDVDFAKLAVRPEVVHSAHVVIMGMGNEYAVYLAEGLFHDLLAEVGSAVYEQPGGFCL